MFKMDKNKLTEAKMNKIIWCKENFHLDCGRLKTVRIFQRTKKQVVFSQF